MDESILPDNFSVAVNNCLPLYRAIAIELGLYDFLRLPDLQDLVPDIEGLYRVGRFARISREIRIGLSRFKQRAIVPFSV